MKTKYYILLIFTSVFLHSCSDFLEVNSPSQYEAGDIYGDMSEIELALNGVYAQLMSGNGFGNNIISNFQMNSDVDFVTFNSPDDLSSTPKRFLAHTDDGNVKNLWDMCYAGIEFSNNFITGLENSPLYTPDNPNYHLLQQKLGEAKFIRAMFYHELVWYFGDVPFTFTRTLDNGVGAQPILERHEILDKLIEDLKAIAPKMQFAADIDNGIERVSKEAVWAMIARMALTAGGYSLQPDKQNERSHGVMSRPSNYKNYYEIVKAYTDSVISSNTHSLVKSYRKVFIDECNYLTTDVGDDVIFEIPFAQNASGSVGYAHGPRCDLVNGSTSHQWGRTAGGATLSAFYRYSFDTKDLRRDYVNLKWYYLADGTPVLNASYTVYNGKWSKFWNMAPALDNTSEGNTGINFPYLRYTDVLLMYAEAINELEGPTDLAKNALKQVRRRAFNAVDYPEKVESYVESATTKEEFLKLILQERKWEFAGENMRWKDLVRNNCYAETIYHCFLRYFVVGQESMGASSYTDYLEEHDAADGYIPQYITNLPPRMFSIAVDNPQDINQYPNTSLKVLEILNWYDKYDAVQAPTSEWSSTDAWLWSGDAGVNAQCLYSFLGYIYNDGASSGTGNTYLIDNNGSQYEMQSIIPTSQLPVVRYILPIPREVIQRSRDQYKNYYGY